MMMMVMMMKCVCLGITTALVKWTVTLWLASISWKCWTWRTIDSDVSPTLHYPLSCRLCSVCMHPAFTCSWTYNTHTHTHTHPFNGPFSGTTRVSRYQKGKINLDFNEARDSERQWHQLDHMQVCTSLQTDNHTSTPPLFFYRRDAPPAAQPTASKHWRHKWIQTIGALQKSAKC